MHPVCRRSVHKHDLLYAFRNKFPQSCCECPAERCLDSNRLSGFANSYFLLKHRLNDICTKKELNFLSVVARYIKALKMAPVLHVSFKTGNLYMQLRDGEYFGN